MGNPFPRHALAVADISINDFLQAAELHRLLHLRLRLFALVLRQVIEAANTFPRRTRSFPAAKRLIAGPRASRGSLRPIHMGVSCLDVLEEEGSVFVIAVATG